MDKEVIVLTGITGYLGSAILRLLLAEQANGHHANWLIRGTMRSMKNTAKVKLLTDYFGAVLQDTNRFEFCECDMNNEAQLKAAMTGAKYLIHTATPVITKKNVSFEFLEKATVQGTQKVLQAAADCHVTRIVLTSSTQAAGVHKTHVDKIDETLWSDHTLSGVIPYTKAKILQEKMIWKWRDDQVQQGRYTPEIVTILPTTLIGEIINGIDDSTPENILQIANNKLWYGYPDFFLGWVDVDDAAFAHLRALEVEEAKNERFIIVGDTVHSKELFQLVLDELDSEYTGHSFRNKQAPYFFVALAALFTD